MACSAVRGWNGSGEPLELLLLPTCLEVAPTHTLLVARIAEAQGRSGSQLQGRYFKQNGRPDLGRIR